MGLWQEPEVSTKESWPSPSVVTNRGHDLGRHLSVCPCLPKEGNNAKLMGPLGGSGMIVSVNALDRLPSCPR